MISLNHTDRARREGTLLGIPFGDLGWFQSVVIAIATGFIAFFLVTFVSIVSLLVYTAMGHANVDFAVSYKRIGLPVGLVVFAAASCFLAFQYARRTLRGGRPRL